MRRLCFERFEDTFSQPPWIFETPGYSLEFPDESVWICVETNADHLKPSTQCPTHFLIAPLALDEIRLH